MKGVAVLMMAEIILVKSAVSKILSDLVSKAIGDGVDITRKKIRDADQNRKSYNQNPQTQMYQIIIDALNKFTYNKYKEQDKLYDAAESVIKGFINSKGNIDVIKTGLKMLVSDANDNSCQYFSEILCHEICKDENNELYKEMNILWNRQMSAYIHGEFEKSNQYDKEIIGKLNDFKKVLDSKNEFMNSQERHKVEYYEIPVENRAEEYRSKWDKNVFLNDFNEEDENVGTQIKLREIYKEDLLPFYIWKENSQSKNELKNLLMKYTINNDGKKMLLILGQPGIGKSTLITWIIANIVKDKDQIFVYQFASDLKNVNWGDDSILHKIFESLNLGYSELENKTLILDGFDEIHIKGDRERILCKMNQELKNKNFLKRFSLIITCRENYVNNRNLSGIDYITLQIWDEVQIKSFCRTYWKKCGNSISKYKTKKILENQKVFGIPLILYMILALDVDIESSNSIMDIYDQIFSLKRGGIYDRCYDTEHRINSPDIKKHIHHITQRIAFWIFENEAEKAYISYDKFKEICKNEMRETGEIGENIQSDTMIGNFFKLKHCEGKGTDELQFVHRSIYEYFVVINFFESIHSLKTKEEVAGKLGELLKKGHLSEQILDFIKYKFDKMERDDLPDIIKKIFNEMLRHGMTYYTKAEDLYNNAIERERNIFLNMLKVVGLWNLFLGKLNEKIIIYLQCNRATQLYLSGIQLGVNDFNMEKVDLSRVVLSKAVLTLSNLSGVDLSGADLSGADLSGTVLSGAILSKAVLSGAILSGTVLSGADLSGADLSGAILNGVDLSEANLSEANLNEAVLSDTILNGANLVEANLSKAVLNKITLNRAILIGTVFSRANLNDVDLNGTVFSGVDFSGAIFNRTALNGADLNGALLNNTIFN